MRGQALTLKSPPLPICAVGALDDPLPHLLGVELSGDERLHISEELRAGLMAFEAGTQGQA